MNDYPPGLNIVRSDRESTDSGKASRRQQVAAFNSLAPAASTKAPTARSNRLDDLWAISPQ